MDGYNGKVAICPLIGNTTENYKGIEFLGLYPYVDIYPDQAHTGTYLWINFPNGNKPVECNKWLSN